MAVRFQWKHQWFADAVHVEGLELTVCSQDDFDTIALPLDI
jgi:hypothetical protein